MIENKSVKYLNLDNNPIAAAGFKALAEMLNSNTTLKELRLASQKFVMGTDAEQAFAEAMNVNMSLIKFSAMP